MITKISIIYLGDETVDRREHTGKIWLLANFSGLNICVPAPKLHIGLRV